MNGITSIRTSGAARTSRGRGRRTVGVAASAVLLALAAACSAGSPKDASGGKSAPLPGEGIGPGGVPTGPTGPVQPCRGSATAATWDGDLPSPDSLPAGSKMAKIRQRGFLIAGVDMSTWLFGYDRDHTNIPQGFDSDIAREIAKAVFGDDDPRHIQFKVVTLADPKTGEIAQLNAGNVDVVVRTTTITCARLQNANFSNPYYTARQRLLLPANADGTPQKLALADMKGKKVCATKNSTALAAIARAIGDQGAYPAANALDCLVYLQQGKVDGVFTDDAILRGMVAQDPKVAITTDPGSEADNQPYGIVTKKGDADDNQFSEFVNGVLARILKPGSAGKGGSASQWATLFANDLGSAPDGPPKIPADYPLGS